MLVLRRACGQSVTIGKNAETIIKVLGYDKGMVVLGFDAEKNVQVDRLEIFERRLLELPPEDRTRSKLLTRLSDYAKKLKNSFANITR